MKIVKKIALLSVVALFLSVGSFAQDIHLSQFDAAPLFYNPALSGNIGENGTGRIIMNYKSQWSTYNTFLVSYDQVINNFKVLGGFLAAGVMINTDYAGETSYGNTQLKLIPAFHRGFDKFFLSAGVDVIMNFNTIDESDIILPDDLNGTDPSNQYTLENSTDFYADLDIGIDLGFYIQEARNPLNFGITANRVLGSGGTFIGDSPNFQRYSFNANTILDITPVIALKPSFILQFQEKYNEINFGTYLRFNTQKLTKTVKNIYIGGWYRWDDSAIAGIAFDFPGFTKDHLINLGISYDITVGDYYNSSKWDNTSSVGKNSFEISLKYIFKKGKFTFTPGGIINEPVM